jgi:hypothetical protein
MRLVRFLARGYHDGQIIEPGTELMIADDVGLGAHMLDLTPNATQPTFGERLISVFRSELAHAPNQALPVPSPEEARAKATEEAIARADRTREAEAAAVAVSVEPITTTKDQPVSG